MNLNLEADLSVEDESKIDCNEEDQSHPDDNDAEVSEEEGAAEEEGGGGEEEEEEGKIEEDEEDGKVEEGDEAEEEAPGTVTPSSSPSHYHSFWGSLSRSIVPTRFFFGSSSSSSSSLSSSSSSLATAEQRHQSGVQTADGRQQEVVADSAHRDAKEEGKLQDDDEDEGEGEEEAQPISSPAAIAAQEEEERALAAKLSVATHLVVLAHGLHGGVDDLVRVAGVLTAAYGDILAILIAKSNHGFLATHEGINIGGERLAQEIIDFAKKMKACHGENNQKLHFSIIGHSLGGMYSRYCIGSLFARGFFDEWEPFNFVTLATPHLGSRRPQRGFNPILSFFTSHLFSKTGRQLMLEDNDVEGGPLLYRMCKPDSSFYKALALFRRRSVYANIMSDLQVPFSTAAIMPYNPYLSRIADLQLSKDYGCILEEHISFPVVAATGESAPTATINQYNRSMNLIVNNEKGEENGEAKRDQGEGLGGVEPGAEKENVSDTNDASGAKECENEHNMPQSEEENDQTETKMLEDNEKDKQDFYKKDARGQELRFMFNALNELQWERIGVKFDNFLSHVNIVCKKTLLEKVSNIRREDLAGHAGFGVLRHLVDHFALAEDEHQQLKKVAQEQKEDIFKFDKSIVQPDDANNPLADASSSLVHHQDEASGIKHSDMGESPPDADEQSSLVGEPKEDRSPTADEGPTLQQDSSWKVWQWLSSSRG